MRRTRIAGIAAGIAAVALLAAGCGSADDGEQGPDAGGDVLTIGMPNGTQTENHSPFTAVAGSSGNSLGYTWAMYEPLVQINLIRPSDEPEPWLAESYAWNDDFTEVTFTAREGVTWSDGEPFTAEDIAFTFSLLKDFPALNNNALPFGDISVDGDTATIGFTAGQYVNYLKPLQQIIVPQHIWKDIADPTTDVNADPIGTGPYVLDTWTPQAATLVPNPDYWGGEPKVAELRYSSFNDNNALTTALSTGEVQWGWTFIADYENVYIANDPEDFHQWAPAGLGIDTLFLNNETKPFNNKAFRQALNMVVDRQQISEVATSGVFPPLDNITGLPQPAGADFLASEFDGKGFDVDVDGARALLEDAGYTWDGSDALIDPDGEAVTFTLTNPAGWNDYLTSLQLVADAAAELGAAADVQPANVDAWFGQIIPNGDFQASLHWTDTGATPWDIYSDIMDGAKYGPLGESVTWNFGRYNNDEATEALATFASTTDADERQAAIETVQRIFVEDVPALAMVTRPYAAQYSTQSYVGWPSEEDPYNQPQPTGPQASQILMHLEPAS